MAEDGELTPKQTLFVAYYVANGFNASKAAIDAGYSPDSAGLIGCENIKKPNVKAAIKKACADILSDVEHLKVKWLNEVNAISFSDFRKVAKFNRDSVEVEDSDTMDDDTARSIESIESVETYDRQGNKVVTKKVKLYSKTKGLDTLGKFLGILKEEQTAGVTIIINGDETKLG